MAALKNISIRYHCMFWVSLTVAFSVLSTGFLIRVRVKDNLEQQVATSLEASSLGFQKMIHRALTLSIRTHLKGICESNTALLEQLYRNTVSDRMSPGQAQSLAKEVLLGQTIGATGYIYVMNSHGRVLLHPDSGMLQQTLPDVEPMARQIKLKKGFLEYNWKKPGEEKGQDKVLYMTYFTPWDWIISATSYKGEFIHLFDLENFKKDVRSFGSDHTGKTFIMDSQGRFLVEPEDSRAATTVRQSVPRAVASADSKTSHGVIHTREDHGGELTVFYRFVPELDWYIGSYVRMDTLDAGLKSVQTLIMICTVIILVLLLPVSLLLGKVIADPIRRLAWDMDQAGCDNFEVRADEGGYGEMGHLARHFNRYMAKLKETSLQIREESLKRGRAEDRLLLFAQVFKNALEGICITDRRGNILTVNQAFTYITGYAESEVLGQNPRVLKSDRHNKDFYREMWQSVIADGHWVGEIWNRRKNGEAYPEILSISAIRNSDNDVTHYVAVFHDISEMKSQQATIEHQSFHDALTGLPNRYLVQDRLDMSIKHARREGDRVVVFFLDIDNFKYINDSLGHATGDVLLQEFGKRLKTRVREQDTVGRLGGDEFLIIATEIRSDQKILEIAERLQQGMNQPFEVDENEIIVSFSLGITSYPEDGDDAMTLVKNADLAMYQAKSQGKNKFSMFTQELNTAAAFRMELVREFRLALDRNEFKVYYQPKVDPGTEQVLGVEALVRWEKEDGSVVSPGDFIPLAEETGLIIPLGHHVMEVACRDIKNLNTRLADPLTVAVNLSPLQFAQADILDEVRGVLEKTGLPPAQLELEITETIMMTDLTATVDRLDLFKAEGISIAIDDFGTGYSSLYYLKIFPISTLKIDQSFIRDICDDQVDAQIVETIILMAKNLGLRVVAEGVEIIEQLNILRTYGCDQIQGYYYARPMPFDQAQSYCIQMNSKRPGSNDDKTI